MNKGLKIGLIVGGSLAVAGLGFFLGRKLWIKAREKREEEERLNKQREELEQIQLGLSTTQTGTATSVDCSKKDRWIPKRNIDMDIINPFSEIKGITLYTAQKSDDPEKGHKYGSGYANVRNSPEVNTKTDTFDYSNQIYTHYSGAIGTIVDEAYDNQNPKHRWFRVKLASPKEDCSGWTGGLFGLTCDDVNYGWVRADNVTFTGKDTGWSTPCQTKFHCQGDYSKVTADVKKVLDSQKNNNPKKYKDTCKAVGVDVKSSFEGMTEVYNTSYQLGASVFPHSNWEEQYLGVNGQKFECDTPDLDL